MELSDAKRSFEQIDQLYEQYGKPLEAEHWGKYVAIREDGRTIVDHYLDVLTHRARTEFGDSPTIITKVGGRIESKPRLLYPNGTPEQQEERRRAKELGDQLYVQYGKPLEGKHWGKYLAVHPDGRTILEDDYGVLTDRSLAELGMGVYVFKVGPRAIHRMPSLRLLPEVEAQSVRRGPSSLVRRIIND